jgi:protein-S-isoprenylcysteine O-methyltransferase Ste14
LAAGYTKLAINLGPHMPTATLNHFEVLSKRFHITLRGVAEALIVVGAFALGEPTPLSLFIGGILCILGEVLRITVAGYGRSVGEMVIGGPYRFVRHPYFLGTGLMFIGIAIVSRSALITAAAILLMVITHRKYAKRDEEQLKKALGPQYGLYVATVPAVVPRLWPAPFRTPANLDRKFSFSVALFKGRHREIDTIISLGLAFGLFYIFYILNYRESLRVGSVLFVILYLVGRSIFFGMRKRTKKI